MENIIKEKDLMLCAEIGDYENAVKALDRGENPNSVNELGWTPLFLGCHHTELTKLLIQKGADVNARCENNRSVIHEAVSYGNIDSVMLLVEAGANVNAQDDDGWTPLHEAVTVKQAQSIKSLLTAGADATIQLSCCEVDSVVLAVEEGGRMLRPFLEHGIDPIKHMVSEDSLFKPLSKSVKCFIDVLEREFEVWDIYRFLCKHRDKKYRELALKNVIRCGAIKCFSAMTDYEWVHLDVKSISENDVFAFIETSSNWEEFLSYLLDRDKDGYILNLRDCGGNTLLHQAVEKNSYSAFNDLIDRGINLEIKNDNGETALSLALDSTNFNMIESLLKRGCDYWNELPETIIEFFRSYIEKDGVFLFFLQIMHLIMIGAPNLLLNACIDGINLFQYAIQKGNKSVVNLMLSAKGIETILNKIDSKTGCTPLYGAVMSGNIDIIEILMEAGADILQTNKNGDKLFEVAPDEEIRHALQHYKNGYNALLWQALNKGAERDIYNLLCRKLDLMFSNKKGECFFNQLVQKVSTGLLDCVLEMCECNFNKKDKTTGKSARDYLEELGEEKRLEIMKKYL